MAAILDQTHFRYAPQTQWARGIGNWIAAEDTNVADWPKGLPFYFIAQIYNSGDAAASIQPALEWREAGGSWNALTTSDSDAVYVLENGWYRSEISTTIQQLSGSGTWVNGKIVTGSDRVASAYTLTNGYVTECVWSITFGDTAAQDTTYELRVTDAGTLLDSYVGTPSIDCAEWKTITIAAAQHGEAWYDGAAWDDTSGYVICGDTDANDVYVRYNITEDDLPRNATVYYAALRPWVRSVTGSGVSQLNVELLDTNNCPALTSDPGLSAYGSPVEWDQVVELIAAAHNVAGAQVATPDLSSFVQSWIDGDLSGGVPDDPDFIGFRLDWDAGKGLSWYTIDHSSPRPMELFIAYTAPYQPIQSTPISMYRGRKR